MTMTIATTESQTMLPETPHGTLTYLTTGNAAGAQAVLDYNTYATRLSGNDPTIDAALSGVALAAIATVVVFAVDAAASATNAGVAIAGLIKDGSGKGPVDALEVEVVNNTSLPIILAECTTSGCRPADTFNTLLPCGTDLVLLTASGKRFDTNTSCGLGFVIGSGTASSSIEAGLKFSYVDTGNPGRWAVEMNIDQSGAESFPQNLQLMGAQFLGNSGFPSFSVYVSPIETTTGKMTVTFVETKSN